LAHAGNRSSPARHTPPAPPAQIRLTCQDYRVLFSAECEIASVAAR
jgi:hypothetical protein